MGGFGRQSSRGAGRLRMSNSPTLRTKAHQAFKRANMYEAIIGGKGLKVARFRKMVKSKLRLDSKWGLMQSKLNIDNLY